MNLELCTDCVEGAQLAGTYGFKRVELCSALSEGGLTPSFGLIRACAQQSGSEIHAMIRALGGSFVCSPTEISIMKEDILRAAEAGASGVVFGILDSKNRISESNADLVKSAHRLGLQATFHRAFDQVDTPLEAIRSLIAMGFDRVLTSGLQPRAEDGIQLISDLQNRFGQDIQIMAGSGVNENNALALAGTGIQNLHFTARKSTGEKELPGMGLRMKTDEDKIRSIRSLFKP